MAPCQTLVARRLRIQLKHSGEFHHLTILPRIILANPIIDSMIMFSLAETTVNSARVGLL